MFALAVDRLLSLGQQVHEQRRKTRAHDIRRYALVARTEALSRPGFGGDLEARDDVLAERDSAGLWNE